MSTFPFDPTGLAPSNLVINESQTPNNATGIDPYLIIPTNTPFYGDNLTVVDNAGDVMVEGTDYYLAYGWPDATAHVGKAIYGGVVLIGALSTGTVKLSYQTIGGDYVDNRANAVVEGLVALNTVLGLDWSTAPTAFPTTPHTHELESLTGMAEVLLALEQIELALGQSIQSVNFNDITDLDIEFVDPLMTKLADLTLAVSNRAPNAIDYTTIVNELNIKISEYDALKIEVQGIADTANTNSSSASNDATAALDNSNLALAADVRPMGALPRPTIDTANNTLLVTASSVVNGGKVNFAAGTYISLCEEVVAEKSGKQLHFITNTYDSGDLDVTSIYYLRFKIVSGVLTPYLQKGTDSDSIPLNLLGTPNAISLGGFDSTVLDMLVAKITTGGLGTTPTVIMLKNSRKLISKFEGLADLSSGSNGVYTHTLNYGAIPDFGAIEAIGDDAGAGITTELKLNITYDRYTLSVESSAYDTTLVFYYKPGYKVSANLL